ncbi:MAG: S8 family serine peptidase [Bacteroidales bacterium]|nr:S8 family serine peptidase [Bacteroidales bacterium]
MKTNFLVTLLFFFLQVFTQSGGYYRVVFKDKNNTPYSLSHPEQFLSQRAIARRQKFNIPIDHRDLPIVPSYITEIQQLGAILHNKSKWFNSAVFFVPDTNLLSQIRQKTFVQSITFLKPQNPVKNNKRRGSQSVILDHWATTVYEASLFASEQNEARINYDYGFAFTQNALLAVDYLHGNGFTGKGMVIAVLDAGFFKVNELTIFDSLRNSGRLLGTKDFVNPGGDVFAQSTHGMAVLSLMAGNVPGKLIGTAPHASYWLLRSEDANSEYLIEEDNWVAAAEFADSVGADIINSSLGYTTFDDSLQDHTYQDMDGNTTLVTQAADIAASKGILVFNSAGNSGNNEWYYIGAPADADSIISVGAVDLNGVLAYFSSRGPTYDGRIKPTVCAPGHMVYAVTASDDVEQGSGTSFSSPILAGAVACLWQGFPEKRNTDMIDVVIKSAHKYTNPDNDYGYGIPNLAIASLLLGGQDFSLTSEKLAVFAYPNPFDEEINLIVYSNKKADLDVQILNSQGKVVFQTTFKTIVGYNYYYLTFLNNRKLNRAGTYFLKVSDSYRLAETKLIKK